MTAEDTNWVYDNINLINKINYREYGGMYITEYILFENIKKKINKIILDTDKTTAMSNIDIIKKLTANE